MYGYIYKTIFPNGKLYVGQSAKYKEFNPNYHGSGVVVKKFYKNHNPNELITTLIEWCNSKEELDEREKFWISELNTLEPNGYNISIGGNGGNLGDITNEKLKVLNQSNRMHNKHHSECTKELMSKKAKQVDRSYLSNYMFITNGIETKKILKTEPIPQGFYKGRTLSPKAMESMKRVGQEKTRKFLEKKQQIELDKYGSLGLSKEEKTSISLNKTLSKLTTEEKKLKYSKPMSEKNKKALSERMMGNQIRKYAKNIK